MIGEARFKAADQLQLLNTIYGNITSLLQWYGNAISLITVFYELHYYRVILSSKKDIAHWINQNVLVVQKRRRKLAMSYVQKLLKPANEALRTQADEKDHIDIVAFYKEILSRENF